MTELDELLQDQRERFPVDDAIEREALGHARRTLRAAVSVQHNGAAGRRSVLRARRIRLIAVLVAAIAAIAALLPGGTGKHTSELGPATELAPATASAQSLLKHAAAAISRASWQPLRPGQFLYFRVVESFPQDGQTPRHATMVEDIWLARNGYARIVQSGPNTVIAGGDVLILHPTPEQLQAERQRQEQGRRLRILAYSQKYFWAPGVDYQQLIRLSTDAGKLRAWIERKAINPATRCASGASDCNIFGLVQSLFNGGPLPPRLSAALYRVIATLPGMRLIGPVRDPLGRPGVAVGYFFKDQPGRDELVFNPASGVFLGERGIALDPRRMHVHATAGAITDWIAVQGHGVVSSDHDATARGHS